MWAFYQDTGSRKWGHPYLTREFFDLVGESMGDAAAAVSRLPRLAADRRRAELHRRRTRFTAVTGAAPRRCRSSISSYAITRRSNGRSGMASLASRPARRASTSSARGYEPVITRSAHFIPNPGFRDAVAEFLDGERAAMRPEAEWLRAGPALPLVLVGIDRDHAAARSRPFRGTSPGW